MSAYLSPGSEEGFEALKAALLDMGASDVGKECVPEEDWAESWKQFFKPVRIGSRVVVRPTWEPFESGPDDVEIVLDPGQAFGTGDHPTTRMCLELIEGLAETSELGHVADIGCGSGILSIAAIKFGAASAVGVDTDPPSIEATLANAERNDVSLGALLGKGFGPLPPDAKYETVLSNIISAALIALAPETSMRVRRGGTWLMSGIIEANWPDVKGRAESVGFTLREARQSGEWVAAMFTR